MKYSENIDPATLQFDVNLSEFQVVRLPLAQKENYWPIQIWSKPWIKVS